MLWILYDVKNEVTANGKFNAVRSSSAASSHGSPHDHAKCGFQKKTSWHQHFLELWGFTLFFINACLPSSSQMSQVLKNYLISLETIVICTTVLTICSSAANHMFSSPSHSHVWIFSQEPQSCSLAWVSMVIGMTFKMHMPPVTFRFLGFTKVPAKISFPPLYGCLFWMGRHGLLCFFFFSHFAKCRSSLYDIRNVLLES